jgi:hypothetical protein
MLDRFFAMTVLAMTVLAMTVLAMTGICVIGLYLSYAIPTSRVPVRIAAGRDHARALATAARPTVVAMRAGGSE